MTDVWQALKRRELTLAVESGPEGKAFAYLFGLVEGFGSDLPKGELDMLQVVSEELAMLLHDALDLYEAHRDE